MHYANIVLANIENRILFLVRLKMIHPTSKFLDIKLTHEERFHGEYFNILDDDGYNIQRKIPIYSSNTKTNYGDMLSELPNILPKVYVKTDIESESLVTNSNRGILAWYVDGSELFTLKENLPKVSRYAITDKNSKSLLWISKPSHPYIGSGKYIIIGTRKEVNYRKDEYFKGEKLKWVVQPLLMDIFLWHEKYKFDLRLYAVVFNIKDKFHVASYNIGIGRRCVDIHDPKKNPMSAITNISVQEKIKGYDPEFHLPLIYDDSCIGISLVKDFVYASNLKRDYRKKNQILILGLDVIFMSDGTPRLIEVNHGPALEHRTMINNNEKIASLGFILGLYGHIIPRLLNDVSIDHLPDWIIN